MIERDMSILSTIIYPNTESSPGQIGISTSSLSARLIIIPVAAVAANRDLIILSLLIVTLPENSMRQNDVFEDQAKDYARLSGLIALE